MTSNRNIILSFISNYGKFRSFTSLRKMKMFATNERNSPYNNGTYYISYPNRTCKYTRLEFITK